MGEATSSGPGIIVAAEQSLMDLLGRSGAVWNLQERQPSIASMWEALSGGRLDQHSRVLVFSDSLMADTANDEAEQVQTARAIVAMSNAGARVFVAVWRPAALAQLQALVTEAANAQGLDPAALVYHLLPVEQGGRAVLDAMHSVLATEVSFPAVPSPGVDGSLSRQAFVPASSAIEDDLLSLAAMEDMLIEPAGIAAPEPPPTSPPSTAPAPTPAPATAPRIGLATGGRPSLPPIGASSTTAPVDTGYPPSASMELLSRPKRPGQITITVTSSKGGSGKSTASILLAGSISRASAAAGKPLSVCLIDLDTRDGQVASLIGKFMPTALNIRVQPVWDEERIRRNLVHAEGLDIDTLLAPIRPRTADTVGPDFYRTIVRSLQRMYDVIIMDTSVQYLEPLIADVALGEADEILFVTTLASTAVQGMARALREITAPLDESGLGIAREKIGIIVNQSLANVGMERDQVLAAGLGVPVVGVIPLATKDVLTATNLNRMYALLDHPLIGPAYNELARACMPGREMGTWQGANGSVSAEEAVTTEAAAAPVAPSSADGDDANARRRGLFRR